MKYFELTPEQQKQRQDSFCPGHRRDLIKDWKLTSEGFRTIPKELHSAVGRGETICPACQGDGKQKFDYESPSTGKWCWEQRDCSCILLKDIEEQIVKTIPEHYRYVDLKTLEPSKKSRLPLDRQASVLKTLREKPDGRYAFFGPAGSSKTTLTFALYRQALIEDRKEHWKKEDLNTTACWRIEAKELLEQFHDYNFSRDMVNEDGVSTRAPEPAVTRRRIDMLVKKGYKPRLFLEEIDKIKESKTKLDVLQEVFNAIFEHEGQLVINTNLTTEEFSSVFGSNLTRRLSDGGKVVDFFTE